MRLLAALCCLLAVPAFAHELKLPALSPAAKVSATAGLTDIAVEYSSPAVKGRKIWGALVPNDQVWRAGANHSTLITFSDAVEVGGAKLPKGTYSFFAIPGAASWTLVLNKNTDLWGSDGYKKEEDAARVTVKPQAIPNRERLTFILSNATNESVNLDLEWEKVRVTLPIKLGTAEQAEKEITEAADEVWVPMYQAARYYFEEKKFDKGLAAIDQSIAAKKTWSNVWVKAQLLAGAGKYKDAMTFAQEAQTLGEANPKGFWAAADVKKALTEWKGK